MPARAGGVLLTILLVAMLFPSIPTSFADPIAGWSDDFNNNQLDTSKWSTLTYNGGSVAETNQRIQANGTSGGSGVAVAGIVTKNALSMSEAIVEVYANVNTNHECDLQISLTKTTSNDPYNAANWYRLVKFAKGANQIYVQKRTNNGSVTNLLVQGWQSASGVLKITRIGGIISFYENGVFLYSEGYQLSSSNVYVDFHCSYDRAYAGSGMGYFDDFKYYGVPPPQNTWTPYDWIYRKSCTITGSNGAGINYPVKLRVHNSLGNDSGQDVYCYGCQSDFDDLRFTSSDGYTLLDYWIESITDGVATVWVEVKEDLSSTRTIFLYYYNPSATSVSNQFLTGITQLREQKGYANFNPGISYFIDGSAWLRIDSTVYQGVGSGWAFFVVPKSWINGKYLRWSWKGQWDYGQYSWEWSVRIYDGDYLRSRDSDFPVQFDPVTKGAGLLQYYDRTASYGFGPEICQYQVNVNSAQQSLVTVFLLVRDAWASDWMNGSWNFIEVNQFSGGIGNVARVVFGSSSVRMEQTGTTGDYGLVRKYVYPEPYVSGWTQGMVYFDATSWGTSYYAEQNETWMGGTTEKVLSQQVSSDVCNLFEDRGYGVEDNWGGDTQPDAVYSRVNFTERINVFTVFLYKGHSYDTSDCDGPGGCTFHHYAVYDNEGYVDAIWDFEVNAEMSNSYFHRLVVLWSCGTAWSNATPGGFNGDHSWGWEASFMGTTGMSVNAYTETSDYSLRCFIGFDNFSRWYRTSTGYQSYNYGDFIKQFFNYTLQGYSIRVALDEASRKTHGTYVYFGQCPLYTGYTMVDPREPWPNVTCWMRIHGDGDLVIPH